ncbi:MAG TPA: hypothetical protein PKA83_02510 [Pirellulaceae bacterium]|nr:hypothetical protein [Pirellulaceae bacterium]
MKTQIVTSTQDEETSDTQDTDAEEPDGVEGELLELVPGEVNEKELRLHLFDGTIICGQLSLQSLSVVTEFGPLTIPIERVLEINPGLDSYPQMLADLDRLVEQLGDADYNQRLEARRELRLLGVTIKHELNRFTDDGNVDRKKYLDELKQEIAKMEAEWEDAEEDEKPVPYIRGDSIRTPDFTVVGKLQQSQFEINSKYGVLSVNLHEVKKVDRQISGRQEIRKKVIVKGDHYIDGSTVSTGIKVNRGDVINISAMGSIVMTPWGANRTSSPDGSNSYGWYAAGTIEGGALCMKIGDNDVPSKVGSKRRIVASRSGVLRLGIGIPSGYSGGNYQYPGQYDVRIVVTPGS